MHIVIVMWDLTRSEQSVRSLREYLRDYAVDAFTQLSGVRLKVWFGDDPRRVWGAVYLWEGADRVLGAPAPSRATELIGYPPTSVGTFEIEAVSGELGELLGIAGVGNAWGEQRR